VYWHCPNPHCHPSLRFHPQSHPSHPSQTHRTQQACKEKELMIRYLAWSMILAVLLGIGARCSLAQGGPGVVIAVSEQGRATVKIGEKEQTVSLPEAKVGDKVVCTVKDTEGTWECTVQK